MRASVVLTCYCWLLVPVSEPAPLSLPKEAHPAVNRWAHLRVPARAGGAWGQSRAECVPTDPGLLDSRAVFLFLPPSRVRQKWGPGSPRPPPPGRPGSCSGSAPGVGDTPSTQQEAWPLPEPPALALLPRETAVTLWLNISLSMSWSMCLFSM